MVPPRLFHFSETPGIDRFCPRPLDPPRPQPPERQWLNGSLVWTVTEERQATYLFPRDCPRILLWLTPSTSAQDREQWFGATDARFIAYMEWAWWERLAATSIYRYELPPATFRPIAPDDWTWVSDAEVSPQSSERLNDLPGALRDQGVDLRLVERLTPLRGVWDTTLHASGIRLANAQGWE